jgi:hypothetical protein
MSVLCLASAWLSHVAAQGTAAAKPGTFIDTRDGILTCSLRKI